MLMKVLEAGKYAGATPACCEDSIATVVCEPAFDTVDTDSLVRVPVLDLCCMLLVHPLATSPSMLYVVSC